LFYYYFDLGELSYPDCEVIFLNIANIHAVRDSFDAICKGCHNLVDEEKW